MKTEDISAQAGNISLNTAALTGQNRFCEIWPTVKEGLEILAEAIKNPLVKLSIKGLIAAGDAIAKNTCK